MLSIQSASLTSGKILRVDNMSLHCEPGRITALLGPNGAGKTSHAEVAIWGTCGRFWGTHAQQPSDS